MVCASVTNTRRLFVCTFVYVISDAAHNEAQLNEFGDAKAIQYRTTIGNAQDSTDTLEFSHAQSRKDATKSRDTARGYIRNEGHRQTQTRVVVDEAS